MAQYHFLRKQKITLSLRENITVAKQQYHKKISGANPIFFICLIAKLNFSLFLHVVSLIVVVARQIGHSAKATLEEFLDTKHDNPITKH